MNVRPWLAGAVCAAAALGFGASASAATHHLSPPPTKGFHLRIIPPGPGSQRGPLSSYGTLANPFWAGYAAAADKNVQIRYVGASFNVPSLNCAKSPSGTSGPAGMTQFVGLDGLSDLALELTGIYGFCANGTTPTYQGWYQMGSNPAQVSPGTVSAGDAIQASVYYNAGTKLYNLILTDATTGQTLWNTNQACPAGTSCKNSSAEAITGIPNGTPPAFTLADYGMESFTGGAVTSLDGLRGGFGSSKLWGSVEPIMQDSAKKTMASPSSLEGGTAFSTTWHSAS